MKNITKAAQRNRSFRRLVGQWFSSLLKRQNGDCQKNFEEVMAKLQDIEDSIEIIARQIARWAKVKPGV
jgi:hypothetical protein